MASSFSSRSDEELLALIAGAGSNHAAFAELVERHAHRFRALAFRFTNNVTEAEDIVQDAFVQLWSKPDQFDATRGVKFTTWFYRLVTNRSLDAVRRKKMRPIGEHEEFIDDAALPDEDLAERERQAALESGIRSLRPDQQTALNLSFYEAVPNVEAAEIMGLSLKAFQSLLMRAKAALREEVGKGMTVRQERSKRYGT